MTEFNFQDENGCSWPKYEDYVFHQFGYMKYDSLTRDKIMKTLKELWDASEPDKHYFIRKSEDYEFAFQALLLGILSNAGLTEYGTSLRGSWLTKKGVRLLKPLFEADSE